jgi:hypothetical protein
MSMAKMFSVKVPDRGDQEMNVLTLIWAALQKVDITARRRIIDYILERAEADATCDLSGGSPDA